MWGGASTTSRPNTDVDHFQRINDAYGHAAGDRVLVALTARNRVISFEPHLAGPAAQAAIAPT